MFLQSEIKDFIKNTLILTLFFTLILHLSWGYVAPMLGLETSASSANSKRFEETSVNYLGNIATAFSLSLGQREKSITGTPVGLTQSIISISVYSRILSSDKSVSSVEIWPSYNHISISSRQISSLLDRSTDRSSALDEHIALLEDYGTDITERILSIDEQRANSVPSSMRIPLSEARQSTNLDTSYT